MAEEELLWGRNRQLFGGIEPSNMLEFTVTQVGNGVAAPAYMKITATIPDDTIIEEQVVCSLKDVVIRKKIGSAPVDEFDGVEFLTITESGEYADYNIESGGMYGYAAFPRSTRGLVNRNPKNSAVVNLPNYIQSFSAGRGVGAAVVLSGYMPSGLAGCEIRRSTATFPKTLDDGDFITELNTDGYFKIKDDTAEEGILYYYTAFPYTYTEGVKTPDLSGHIKNRSSCLGSKNMGWYYGYDLILENSNPDTRVIYPIEVDNARYVNSYMSFTAFVSNSWNLEAGHHFMPKPCMLNHDGEVDYYLNPNNYMYKLDGTTSDVTSSTYAGDAMMEWPLIYVSRTLSEDGLIYRFRISDVKADDSFECWSNYNYDDDIVPKFYTAIYASSMRSSGSYYQSKSATSRCFTQSTDTSLNVTLEKLTRHPLYSKGLHYSTYCDYKLICDLTTMITKATNVQHKIGLGTTNISISTGQLNDKGLFYGNIQSADNTKLFGMENLYYYSYSYWEYVSGAHYCAYGHHPDSYGDFYYHETLNVKFKDGTYNGSSQKGYYPEIHTYSRDAYSHANYKVTNTYDYPIVAECSHDGVGGKYKGSDPAYVGYKNGSPKTMSINNALSNIIDSANGPNGSSTTYDRSLTMLFGYIKSGTFSNYITAASWCVGGGSLYSEGSVLSKSVSRTFTRLSFRRRSV